MSNVQEWQQLANKELSRRDKKLSTRWFSKPREGIAIKPLYTEADLDNLEATCSCSPPYVRGPRATMRSRLDPWTILSDAVFHKRVQRFLSP